MPIEIYSLFQHVIELHMLVNVDANNKCIREKMYSL